MGKRAAAPRGRRRRRSSSSGRGGGRRSAGPILLLALGLIALCLGGGAALAHWHGRGEPTATGPGNAASPLAPPARTPVAEPPPAPSPPAAASPRAGRSAPPREAVKDPAPVTVPSSGDGTFTSARTSGGKVGSGTPRRYRVQVEDGIDISAGQAAEEIQKILAHPQGWAANGRGSFQLVDKDADFVIRIATPKTADALCLAQGLDTGGELNCETVDGVVVNLKRWMLGSPTFSGTPAEYRHLIINHEVGHEIGIREHMGCSGAGKLAPVMMQQIKGLDGCESNAWPYDTSGRYITGPVV
ncbi:DUF3152 domain-containing protein [Streptomyces sp. SP18CS02]|uniref:DUF3152 domain-containing protein n=1 Tax=Streptomyces sp. SP18CS02 TaxID=3002531 RepID=UPI002E7A336E|nr:DUF3152 domain-containing protein [Streptomyces sp. SP18CS02]MEE1753496.1 DUF3152 domain-containing protein [Streptomyces sp. SP18CS02]